MHSIAAQQEGSSPSFSANAAPPRADPATRNLILLAFPRVQRFISEARKTADLRAGSIIFSRLAEASISDLTASGAEIIMPSVAAHSIPNRIAALLPVGLDDAACRRLTSDATAKANACWQDMVGDVYPPAGVDTPGFPQAVWVIARADGARSYAQLWYEANRQLAARKRIRDFPAYASRGQVCGLTGRWTKHDRPSAVAGNPREQLSAVAWVKRGLRDEPLDRFPSTASLATASFRIAVARHVSANNSPSELTAKLDELCGAVKGLSQCGQGAGLHPRIGSALGALSTLDDVLAGAPAATQPQLKLFLALDGSWLFPDTWELRGALDELGLDPNIPESPRGFEEQLKRGRKASEELISLAEKLQIAAGPAKYLAILAQDGDDIGEVLSRQVSGVPLNADRHRAMSEALRCAAEEQVRRIEKSGLTGRSVYAGGDDLLAMLSAADAFAAAHAARSALAEVTADRQHFPKRPTASSALLFFHYAFPLQEAVRRAQEALEDAKKQDDHKDRLALVVVRRGGERARAIVPWSSGNDEIPLLSLHLAVQELRDGRLSPGLIGDLEHEQRGLAELTPNRQAAEVQRLVRRHYSPPRPEGVTEEQWESLRKKLVRTFGEAMVRLAGSSNALNIAAALAALLQVAHFVAQEAR